MAVLVPVPCLGLSTPRGRLSEWYHPDGTTVEEGEPVCCVEWDQVVVEVEAETGGILRHRIPAGGMGLTGEALGVILAPGERVPEFPSGDPWKPSTAESPALERLSDDRRWHGSDGPPDVNTDSGSRITDAASPQHVPAPITLPLRRTSSEPEREYQWDTVPGDRADFETSLWPESQPPEPLVATLREPGGAIPDLPVWDEPEAWALAHAPLGSPDRSSLAPEASTHSESLVLRTTVSLAEASKMQSQLTHEWRAAGVVPSLEDIVVRAAARAWREYSETDPSVALRVVAGGPGGTTVLTAAATRTFRDAVTTICGTRSAAVVADLLITTFRGTGIDDATPRLEGAPLGLTMGDVRAASGGGDTLRDAGIMTVSLAYAPEEVADGAAASFLSRLRELIEAPYALLAE